MNIASTLDEAELDRARRAVDREVGNHIRKLRRKARVSRQGDIRPTRDDMSVEHRAKMARRKARNANMQPGFEPTPNKRVGTAFNTAFMARVQQGHSPVDAHNLALRDIARLLPMPRMTRPAPKPSKSDDPAYRKPIVLKRYRTANAAN